jgi:hypothetical protein
MTSLQICFGYCYARRRSTQTFLTYTQENRRKKKQGKKNNNFFFHNFFFSKHFLGDLKLFDKSKRLGKYTGTLGVNTIVQMPVSVRRSKNKFLFAPSKQAYLKCL